MQPGSSSPVGKNYSDRLTRSSAVPKRIDEAIKKLRYIDYSLLARSAREKAAKDDETLVITDGRVVMKSKVMNAEEEREISQFEWLAAAQTVEKKTLEYHGTARSEPLKAHHKNVLELTNSNDWGPARIYDKKIRELMAGDLQHDPSVVNQQVLNKAALDFEVEKAKASLFAQQSMLLRSPTSAYPAPTLFPNTASQFSPTSPSQHSPPGSFSKRFNPYDQAGRQSRPNRSKCF